MTFADDLLIVIKAKHYEEELIIKGNSSVEDLLKQIEENILEVAEYKTEALILKGP